MIYHAMDGLTGGNRMYDDDDYLIERTMDDLRGLQGLVWGFACGLCFWAVIGLLLWVVW